MRKNITTDTDIYKFTHWKAVPEDMDGIYSYGEPRVGAKYKELCYIGLQMILMDHFQQRVTETMIKEGERRAKMRLGFDSMYATEIWDKVRKLGYLPIRIKSVPEGTVVPVGNVMFTFEATEKWFAKVAQSLESTLMHVWYPTEISSRAFQIKKNIFPAFVKSTEKPFESIQFAVNDFGYRGATCHEAAARAGAAFLAHFAGSDNEPAMTALADYYGCDDRLKSVWATEHSVALAWGKEFELDYVKHQLTNSDPSQIVSIVADTKDQDAFFREIACHPEVVELVKQRSGRVVWRPDSDVPLTNVIKYSDVLGSTYGFTMNSKGYKLLKENVGLIQGDGMDEVSIPELFNEYIKTGWSADNVVTGSGGGLLQVDASRDSNRWAIKPSQISRNGKWTDVSKTPKSDPTKTSKSGRLKLHNTMTGYHTIQSDKETEAQFAGYADSLETVFENGALEKTNFDKILTNTNKAFYDFTRAEKY